MEQGAQPGEGCFQGLLCSHSVVRVTSFKQRPGNRGLQGSPLANTHFHTIEGSFASSQRHKPFIPCPLCPALHESKAWALLEMATGQCRTLTLCQGWIHTQDGQTVALSPTTASPDLLASSHTNLSPPPLETGKAQLLGHTQHSVSSTRCRRGIRAQDPSASVR